MMRSYLRWENYCDEYTSIYSGGYKLADEMKRSFAHAIVSGLW